MTILAIDQGTTSTRAVVVDERGQLDIVHSRPNPASHPQPDWIEQDPTRVMANLRSCLDTGAAAAGVVAVGLSNQGESCLAWEAGTGRPLAPIISWQDSRTTARIEQLEHDGVGNAVQQRAGLPLDAYFSASKLAWLLENIPEARALAGEGRLHLGTTDAWFREVLTGRFETDVTTASRTSLMNLENCQWDPSLCRLFGVPMDTLPRIGPSSGDLGRLSVGTQERHARELPLVASLVDQQAALYGHGCRQPGDTKMTFGTGAFASVVTGSGWPPKERSIDTLGTASSAALGAALGAVPTVAWQRAEEAPVRALDGGVYSAASAINWARSLGLFSSFEEIEHFGNRTAASRGLFFVPALAGLGCPHWDRVARGCWMGMSGETTSRDLVQAILEGIAFRMLDVTDAIERHQPISSPLRVDGGMSANDGFCQCLADTLGHQLQVSGVTERTALGTAMLAAEALGESIALPSASRNVVPTIDRDDSARVRHRERFDAARRACQAFGDVE